MNDGYTTSTLDALGEIAKNEPRSVDNGQIIDNRIRLQVDSKMVESWELVAMENDKAKFEHLLFIFSRYAANADGLLSPEIPNRPIDELTARDIAEIRASKAYRALKHFTMQELGGAVKSFIRQATAGLDPN